MGQQVTIQIEREIYDRLQELRVPPTSDINGVLSQLLFNAGHGKSRAVIELEAQQQHRSYEEELQATINGLYDGSGISS